MKTEYKFNTNKMKKIGLLIFLIISCFGVQAQDKQKLKQEAIDFIKMYYTNFETASNEYDAVLYGIEVESGHERPIRKITANYKVQFDDCKFTMSFDAYKWPHEEKLASIVFEFNLYEIESIQNGPFTSIQMLEEPILSVGVNSSILFRFKSGNKAKVFEKNDDEELIFWEDEILLKMHPDVNFTIPQDNTKLIVAFERLRLFCIANK